MKARTGMNAHIGAIIGIVGLLVLAVGGYFAARHLYGGRDTKRSSADDSPDDLSWWQAAERRCGERDLC